MRGHWFMIALPAIAGASPSSAATPTARPQIVDYERTFAQAFPGAGTEHRIADWTFYAALVAGDVVTYAQKVDPAIAKRAGEAQGKPYQLQQVEMSVKRDARLVAAFDDQRRRIQAMVVYVDGSSFANDRCRHLLTYVENEFRLVLGESGDGADPLSHATIAPSCSSTLVPGVDGAALALARPRRCRSNPLYRRQRQSGAHHRQSGGHRPERAQPGVRRCRRECRLDRPGHGGRPQVGRASGALNRRGQRFGPRASAISSALAAAQSSWSLPWVDPRAMNFS
jgi:hypothetical protein